MNKRIVFGALRLSLIAVFVAMAGTEASAQICTSTKTRSDQKCVSWRTLTAGGPQFCTKWCTGSAVVDILIKAVNGSDINVCTATQNSTPICPEVTATVFGTVTPPNSTVDCTPDTSPNAACFISGFGFCLPPGCDPGHTNDPQCRDFDSNGEPMELQEDGLTEGGILTKGNCTNNGTCSLFFELEAQPSNTFCPNTNWLFKFTPVDFVAQVEFCPGGTANGVCCASTSRTTGGVCAAVFTNSEGVVGAPSRNLLHCTLNGTPQLGQQQTYQCDELLGP